MYLVVLFHAGSERFEGGFIGVDVFFVLSGYLITQLMMREIDEQGSLGLSRFYGRRFRRLLPASLITLAVTAPLYAALANPQQIDAARGAFRAAYLYVSNWYFIDQSTDYFSGGTARNPVLHFWSLAVEEQFYLLWPPTLLALFWVAGRLPGTRPVALRLLVLGGGLASVTWALVLRADHPDRAYFGTDTRAYQLLAGAFIALTPTLIERAARSPRITRIASGAALLLLVGLSLRQVELDPIERGIAATIVTCVLIAGLDADVAGPIQRALSLPTASYLGRVSYGTYLWHWPVIILLTQLVKVSPIPLFGITVLIATGLASLSYHLVELPIRHSPTMARHARLTIAGGLALSLLGAFVLVPRALSLDGSAEASVPVVGNAPPSRAELSEAYFEGFGETVACVGDDPSACTVEQGTRGHILLMGDSNAQMYIPAFTALAETEDVRLSLAVTPGCPWQRDTFHELNEEIRDQCQDRRTDAYDRVIPALDPDLIVLVNAPPLNEHEMADEDTPANRRLRDRTASSLRELAVDGRQLLIIESAPSVAVDKDPYECLGEAAAVEECRFVASTTPSWIEEFQRSLAEDMERVTTVDFDTLVCPYLPICDPVLDGQVVFWNGRHITADYSRSLADEIGAYLRDEDLLPG